MKEAFLVLGPCRSGTHFFTELLTKCGYHGEAGDYQQLDYLYPETSFYITEDKIVWRRSIPHGRTGIHSEGFPNIYVMIETLRLRGYNVKCFVTEREWFSMTDSCNKNWGGDIRNCWIDKTLQNVYPYLFSMLSQCNVPFIIVNYEAMILYGSDYINKILNHFNLPSLTNEQINFKDGNKKYWNKK